MINSESELIFSVIQANSEFVGSDSSSPLLLDYKLRYTCKESLDLMSIQYILLTQIIYNEN